MKLKQLLTNKRIVIVAIGFVLALIVAIVLLVTPNSRETNGSNSTNTKAEQDKVSADSQDDKDEVDANHKEEATGSDNSSLEVLEPNEVAPEDSTNASGSWDDASASENQTTDEDKTDDGEESEQDEDILDDDISWGNIY